MAQDTAVGRIVRRYTADQGWFLAAAVAYNAFFSMLPIILLVVTLLGLAFRDPTTLGRAIVDVTDTLPAEASGPVLDVIRGSAHGTGLLGVASIVGLLWVGVGLFCALWSRRSRCTGGWREAPVSMGRALGLPCF